MVVFFEKGGYNHLLSPYSNADTQHTAQIITMMESNDYGHYDDSYNEYVGGNHEGHYSANEGNENISGIIGESSIRQLRATDTGDDGINKDNDDPRILSLPRILLMGPRRGGKTSIQVRLLDRLCCQVLFLVCCCCFV
jgi:hypothetical protein